MNVDIKLTSESGPLVSEHILSQNIEMCLTTADGLLSERLRNPKFMGPPHRMTGVAAEWQGNSFNTSYELTPGAGLMGSEAQFVRNTSRSHDNLCLHQNKIPVRKGETLELELWARTCHQPITLRVELHPLSAISKPYDTGEIHVDTSFFKRYTLLFKVDRDDNEARLQIHAPESSDFWIDQIHLRPVGEPHLCSDVVRAMADMKIPSLRFPGGIVCNVYNWRHGTGPVHLRPMMLDAAFHHEWILNYDFGLDEFLSLCLDQNMVPTITLNVATGTPDEAADMAAYCADWYRKAGVEPPMIYWHIANHPYFETTAHMTPAMYVEVLKAFVPAVKEHYPHSRIVAPMASSALAGENYQTPWKEMLLEQAADWVDVVEVQVYGRCDPEAQPSEQMEIMHSSIDKFASNMRSFIDECRSRGVNFNAGIAEWNWWMQASHHDGRFFEEPPTVLHGLYIAAMIHRFAAMAPDFEIAHFYNLVNCMGILNHRGADFEVTDSVRVFNLYRCALPARLLPLELTHDDPELEGFVEAMFLATDTDRWLFVTNRHPEQTVQLSLKGLFKNSPQGEGLQGASTTGNFTSYQPTLDSETLNVPPLSLIRLHGSLMD